MRLRNHGTSSACSSSGAVAFGIVASSRWGARVHQARAAGPASVFSATSSRPSAGIGTWCPGLQRRARTSHQLDHGRGSPPLDQPTGASPLSAQGIEMSRNQRASTHLLPVVGFVYAGPPSLPEHIKTPASTEAPRGQGAPAAFAPVRGLRHNCPAGVRLARSSDDRAKGVGLIMLVTRGSPLPMRREDELTADRFGKVTVKRPKACTPSSAKAANATSTKSRLDEDHLDLHLQNSPANSRRKPPSR